MRGSEAAARYLEEHGAQQAVLVAVRRAVAERPPDAVAAIARYLMEAAETDEAAATAALAAEDEAATAEYLAAQAPSMRAALVAAVRRAGRE